MSITSLDCRFAISGAAAGEIFESWVEADHAQSLSPLFRLYYQLRPYLPIAVRQRLQRKRGLPESGGADWYQPSDQLATLASALQHQSPISLPHPWPGAAQYAFTLTHDVETEAGQRNILKLVEIEEEFGFRSSWNFVPYAYKVDRGLLAELKARSCEVGVHGYNHDGRLFSSRQVFEKRAVAINHALDDFGAVGFRAPMVHRNLEWMQSLEIEYDGSCFDVDPFQPMPGGVGSVWPFIAGRFVELPYTLPQDHTLFVVLNRDNCDIWKRKLEFLQHRHGLALMLTHPDYLDSPQRVDLYRELLATVAESSNYWHALPREIAQWWRIRDAAETGDHSDELVESDFGPVVPAALSTTDGDFVIEPQCSIPHQQS